MHQGNKYRQAAGGIWLKRFADNPPFKSQPLPDVLCNRWQMLVLTAVPAVLPVHAIPAQG